MKPRTVQSLQELRELISEFHRHRLSPSDFRDLTQKITDFAKRHGYCLLIGGGRKLYVRYTPGGNTIQ